MRVVVIDNYDSFVYNLVQYLGELGAEPVVHRHDALDLDALIALEPDAVLMSPGPGVPRTRACRTTRSAHFGERGMPVLGVCLGHQCIGQVYGGDVVRAPHVMHGKTSTITHDGRGVFAGVAEPVHRDALPLTGRRRAIGARRARGHGRERGRARDGTAPPRAPDRRRAVPPRVDPHRVGARPPAQLPRRSAPEDSSATRRSGPTGGARFCRSRSARPSATSDASAAASSWPAGAGRRAGAAITSPRRWRKRPAYRP